MCKQKELESVYERYNLNGLIVTDFCIKEGINKGRFYYWKNKQRDHYQESGQSSGFTPIVFSAAQKPCNNVIEIVYPNGVIVRIPSAADIKQLQSLILLIQSSHV